MESQTTTVSPIETTTTAGLAAFTSSVFGWMTVGLFATALVAWLVSNNSNLFIFFYKNPWILIVSFIAQLALVVTISGMIQRLSTVVAGSLFILYSLLNGVMFSAIFLAYDPSTIAIAVGATALTFTAMAIYGAYTKADLTKWGSFAIMALIGVIIATILNIFFKSEGLTWLLTYASLAIFIVLTAYDVQKIKEYHRIAEQTGKQSLAISAALALYLDFINLLILILRILGKGKN